MTQELRRTRESIFTMEGQIKGTIRIGSSDAVAKYLLPDILSTFLAHHPSVDVKLVTGFTSKIANLLSHGEIHIALLRENIGPNAYQHLLSTENLYLVSNSPVELTDLPSLARINYITNPSLQMLINQWWSTHFQVPPTISMEVDSAETCKELVRAGLGYAILTGLLLASEPDLHCRPLYDHNHQPLRRETWIYSTNEALSYLSVRTFIEFLIVSVPEFIERDNRKGHGPHSAVKNPNDSSSSYQR